MGIICIDIFVARHFELIESMQHVDILFIIAITLMLHVN